MESYRNYTTITSQLYFCASPIRIDTYNKCQFGCVYCFSRNRKGDHAEKKIQKANTNGFEHRLTKVKKGKIDSALDEFIQRSIPIQLGGLFDPFSPIELAEKATLKLMRVLEEHQYPTLISTKGNIFLSREYSDVLRKMNVYFRISAAGISERFRSGIDVGADSFEVILDKIKFLVDLGLPVSLRIQPVIMGFEEDALRMTYLAAQAGVCHVSYEYLKITSESKEKEVKHIFDLTGINIWTHMRELGFTKIGRDYTLSKTAKLDFLIKAKKLCSDLKIRFGAGDTEFIHLSDGSGCCNGSSFFLKNSNQFKTNFVGIISDKVTGDQVRFDDLKRQWLPQQNVHRYLTTNSRSRDISGKYGSLLSLMAYRWNGGKGPYSPAFFAGVSWKNKYDTEGFKIYAFENPFLTRKEKAVQSKLF